MSQAQAIHTRREFTRELVDFLHGLKPEDLPAEVIDRARYFLLDYLAVAVRGSREESARCVQRMIERTVPSVPANQCAHVIGTRMRTLPGYAAFANGTSSHGIEQDDTHSGGSIHLGTTMYSVALAVAEQKPTLQQPEFLTAVVAGYEASARLAMAVQPKEQYALGFHPTQTCGVFGATITAARLLGLTAEQTLSAVGIAGSMAAGSMEFLAEGAWTKRIHPGLAARNGMDAAMLAAEGFTGPAHMFEGRDGFLHSYSRNAVVERLTDNLGATYQILHTAVKPHSCCRYMQGPVDAIVALMREHALSPDNIHRIEVAVLEAGWGIVAEPRVQKYAPQSIVDAQFSMPFGAAVAALYGAAGLDQFTLKNIGSAAVHKMMGKVVLMKDARLETTFPKEWPARVTIETSGGARVERFVRYPKGDPENPLTWEEMALKFRSLAGAVLSADRCDAVIQQLASANPGSLPALCAV